MSESNLSFQILIYMTYVYVYESNLFFQILIYMTYVYVSMRLTSSLWL